MSIYSNVTEQDLIILRKLAEQQKNQRAEKIKNRISKQTHDIKLAESLSPITKKLAKVHKSTKKLGTVIKESNSENEKNQEIVPVEIESDNSEGDNINPNIRALPNSSLFSDIMTRTLGRLISSANSLRIKASSTGPTILGVPVHTLGGDRIEINENIYDLTPEIYKALSDTGYTGKNMKSENDILKMNNIIRDLGYTSMADKPSKRKTFFTTKLPELVEEIQNKTFNEIDLEGQGVKIIIPSNIIDNYTRLDILLGLKLSGHSEALREASNLIDELYKRGEIQNKQPYRNALNKFS